MNDAYRVGTPGYLVMGVVAALFFAGCALGAFMSRQYPPIVIFAFFLVMAVMAAAHAGTIELSEHGIKHQNRFGTFYMGWEEVRRIESGPAGAIILHGDDKRFAVIPVTYWWGREKADAVQFFHAVIHQLDAEVHSSLAADYKIHRKVRVHR